MGRCLWGTPFPAQAQEVPPSSPWHMVAQAEIGAERRQRGWREAENSGGDKIWSKLMAWNKSPEFKSLVPLIN